MVSEFTVKNMLPLNLWSKQSLQAAQASETSSATGGGSLLAQMPFGHPLAAAAAAAPGFLPVSFNSALFRPGEHTAHGLYSYHPALHPSFFRPHLDPAALGTLLNHRGMAALHHASIQDGARDPHPSAFTPAKRLRLHDDNHSPRDNHSPHSPREDMGSRDLDGDRDTSGSSNRTSPLTPIHRPSYSPATRPSYSPASSLQHRVNGDMAEQQYVAEDLRLKWRCEDGGGIRCPICKALLQAGEIRNHLYKELTSLKETLQNKGVSNEDETQGHACDINETSKSRYDTFLRIRRNRETRLGKLRGDRKRKRYSDEMSHTSLNEHDDVNVTSDHMIIHSPQRETLEEETVDVTSCEEPEVSLVYTSSPIPRQSPDTREENDKTSTTRQSPFLDQHMT